MEAELRHQKVLLQEIREPTTHHSLTKAENSTLTGAVKTTMAKHQTETATLAAQLAAKCTGGNKRKRTQTENQSPPPNNPEATENRVQKKWTRTRAPGEAQHPDTSTETEETSVEKRNTQETQRTHPYA